ncbi:MAG: FecR domain-containing protein, partial [Gemmataceae bacterium]
MPNEELRSLLQRLSDGDLSPQEAERLSALLHGDPEACELYLDHVTLEAHLHGEFGGPRPGSEALPGFLQQAQQPATAERRHGYRGPAWQTLHLAAAVLLGALGSFLLLRNSQQPAPDRPAVDDRATADCVATLLFADDCEWRREEKLVEGQRLCAGPLQLERGLALLRFDGGAAVVVEGPTELQLESRGSARLASGKVTVRAPAVAAGFTIRTPASDVVDLGTEFALVVERDGATEVHVLEGEVAYAKPGTPQEYAELLKAGQAIRYDQARGELPRVVPLNAPRFNELLSQAKIGPRDDLLHTHEGFNSPVGLLPLDQADGGIGWAGPWGPTPGTKAGYKGDLTIAFAKLDVPWPVQGGRGP